MVSAPTLYPLDQGNNDVLVSKKSGPDKKLLGKLFILNKFKLFSISLNIHQNQAEFALLHEVECVKFQPDNQS